MALSQEGSAKRKKEVKSTRSKVNSLEIFWREEKAERNEERREVEEVNLR